MREIEHGWAACTFDNPLALSEWIIAHTGGQAMLNLTCTMILSVDLARHNVSHVKDMGIWGL